MDTGTHLVMGFALGGLATLDPVIADSTVNFHAVLAATVIGSQIPDIDTVLKFKNNAVYIRNHRGVTHSVPAVLLWPILISIFIHLIVPEANFTHLWMWSFIAVFFHVFVDIFNAYGTQALRPFSSRWVALGVINTFDPFIFSIHVVGLFLWIEGANPGVTFLFIYFIVFLYYLSRFYFQSKIRQSVLDIIPDAETIIIAPTMRYLRWRIAVMTKDTFYVARGYKESVTILDTFKRKPVPNTPIFEAAKKDKNISAFLSFSPVYRWEVNERKEGFEVRFIDLRYRSNGHYPFVAVVNLDEALTITGSYTGWIYNTDKLKKKLDVAPR